jgi:hypothetical protein
MFESKSGTILLAAFALASILTGCLPANAPPPPTPLVMRLQITPALSGWSGRVHECALQNPSIGLAVDERPASALDLQQADAIMRLGPLPQPAAYPLVLGWEEVVLIANLASPRDALGADELRSVFNGKTVYWSTAAAQPGAAPTSSAALPIHPWTYPAGDDLRAAFEAALWSGQPPAARISEAPGPAAMLQAVAEDPAAIGYVPKSLLNNTVRELTVKGALPGNLQQPVLVLVSTEPQGALRAFLVCLQNSPG